MSYYLEMPIDTNRPYKEGDTIDSQGGGKIIVASTWDTIDGIHPLDSTMGGSTEENQPDEEGWCSQALVGVHASCQIKWLRELNKPVPRWLIQFDRESE